MTIVSERTAASRLGDSFGERRDVAIGPELAHPADLAVGKNSRGERRVVVAQDGAQARRERGDLLFGDVAVGGSEQEAEADFRALGLTHRGSSSGKRTVP